ncbi:uncharacterized protein ATNIH1004_006772 [Aspergillus tanneri]|uniref:NAD-dependent epimerase/dehydratase domain-containing protein n=1 Tax=Aspergillus tanneri TaxID=1220188 RepID=A0A5M9MK54_9EURO|nr:uncharacterized protein ATNIH1004_006772 [Aspergillus tanneri]KAA8645353.1 hypothetical protein ATNIH1004_006772 [Aspergillus tanneri]
MAMTLILTGSTSFVGRKVLEQCLQNTSITSIANLFHRVLPAAVSSNPKPTVRIVDDF